jgi:AAA+ ATPase superfamily predicted ATPase
MFVNRLEELTTLDQWWNQRGSAMAVVWGRRRVGKSQLLRHWALDKRAVIHVARNRALAEELAALSQAVAIIAPGSRRDLIARPFHDWDDAFDFLAAAAASEPLLIVIDEFPELLKSSPTLESALRAIWERIDGTCQLRLILCGSAVRAMEALQTQDAPLFNRMTLRLQVNPFRPSEVSKMLPGASPLERAAAWGVCGGIPFYLSAWDENLKFRDNIAKLFCNEYALLLSEGEFVLATEDIAGGKRDRLPEQVLRAISGGNTSFSAIKSLISTLPQRTLADLEQLRLIARIQPVTEKESTKLSYYRIADNFLAFWLTVIERHRPAIDQGLGKSVLDVIVEEFDDFMGARWEEALRIHVRGLANGDTLGKDIVAVGEYWNRQSGPKEDPSQLDLVALAGRSRKVAAIGEAKWSKSQSGAHLLDDLRRKVAAAKLPLTDSPIWVLCARDSITKAPPNCLPITAHDIFA